VSYGTSIAYLLWLGVLRRLLGVTAEDSPTSIRGLLRERVRTLCPEQIRDEVFVHLGRLLSLPLTPGEEASFQHLEGDRLKAATFRAVETLIQYAAGERPLILVCEDLHWADPTSLELLERLLALTDRTSLLFICGMRPQVEHGSWQITETAARLYRHRHTSLWLGPLSSDESQTLVGNLLRLPGLPERFLDSIVHYAEGNPFYVEEIVRSLIASGAIVRDDAGGIWRATQDLTEMSIPDTLHGVLTARIDRLDEEAKRVLQIAAVIGRVFLYRVLAAIAATESVAWEKCTLEGHLLALQRAEMIRERARIPEVEYIFKHELTREAAYSGLLKRQRRVLHGEVAEAIERLFPERIEELLGLLAHHWEQAEAPREATEYLLRAGDKARLAYANQEAIGYYRRALAVLEAPRAQKLSVEWRREVATSIYEGLGDVLQWTGDHDGARAAYQDALARAPENRALWRARLHLGTGSTWRRQRRYEEALQAYDLAQTALDAEPTKPTQEWWREWVQVQIERMWTHYWLAEWHEIAELAEKVEPAVEQYGTLLHRSRFFSALALMAFRRDRYVVSEETLGYNEAALAASQELGDLATIARAQFELGFAQLWLGDLDRAEENLQASLTLAERTGDVTIQARCLTYLTIVCRKRGQVQETCRYISRSLPVATAAQMPEYLASAKANQAWVSWREENLAEAEQSGRAALELWQQMPLVYPFQWSALWPLMATALADDRISDAVGHTRALLEPAQQRLPDPLTRQLEEGIGAWDGGELRAADACLHQCIELAQEMGYL
jgi:tetratricopeptide (TPR) repeat protein